MESRPKSFSSGRWVPSHGYENVFRDGIAEKRRVEVQAFVPNPLPPDLPDDSLGRLLSPLMSAERS